MDLWAEILAQCLSRELVQFVFHLLSRFPFAVCPRFDSIFLRLLL